MSPGEIVIQQHPPHAKFLGQDNCFGFASTKIGLQHCYGERVRHLFSMEPTLLFSLDCQINCWFTCALDNDFRPNRFGNRDVLTRP